MRSELMTTGQIADYCQVTHRAVLKWITAGKLKAYRTPGRHSRVNTEDFLSFLHNYDMPIPEKFQFMYKDKKRVLVVEDDRSTSAMIKKCLMDEGFDVQVAYDGFEAGILFAVFQPHLITLDLMMPKVNGFEVCSMIRKDKNNKNIKILIVSGHVDKRVSEKIKKLGADDFMSKPIYQKELIKKCNALLRKRGVVHK